MKIRHRANDLERLIKDANRGLRGAVWIHVATQTNKGLRLSSIHTRSVWIPVPPEPVLGLRRSSSTESFHPGVDGTPGRTTEQTVEDWPQQPARRPTPSSVFRSLPFSAR